MVNNDKCVSQNPACFALVQRIDERTAYIDEKFDSIMATQNDLIQRLTILETKATMNTSLVSKGVDYVMKVLVIIAASALVYQFGIK